MNDTSKADKPLGGADNDGVRFNKNAFDGYRSLNKQIGESHEDKKIRAPLTFLVFEHEIRRYQAGYKSLHFASISRLSSFSVSRYIYRIYLSLISNTCFSSAPKVYVFLPKCPSLQVAFIKTLSELSIKPIAPPQSKKIKAISLSHLSLTSYPLSSLKFFFILRMIQRKSLMAVFDNPNILSKVEENIEKEIKKTQKVLRKNNVKGLVCNTDFTPKDRVLVAAANRLEIEYTVIAHGYIQDQTLLSYAPIKADNLLVWSEKQKLEVQAAVTSKEKSKVKYYGWPKLYQKWSKPSRGQILVVFPPISGNYSTATNRESSKILLNELVNYYREIKVRLHPRESGSVIPGWLSEMLQSGKIEMSNKELEEEFDQSLLVVGLQSSTLMESALYGVPTFQYSEGDGVPIEGVKIISVGDISMLSSHAEKWEHCSLLRGHKYLSENTDRIISLQGIKL